MFEQSKNKTKHQKQPNQNYTKGMDVYSNILYVQEAFGPLSHLAHRLAATDKYRPETCCVIGNYYSLKVLCGWCCVCVCGVGVVARNQRRPKPWTNTPNTRQFKHTTHKKQTNKRACTSARSSTFAARCACAAPT